jgi:hypothetical protein
MGMNTSSIRSWSIARCLFWRTKRAASDCTALDNTDGLRPQPRDDHLASFSRRSSGIGHAGIQEYGLTFSESWPGCDRGRTDTTGTHDRKVRALDSATGKVLWENEMRAGLEGMPAVYQIDGREYVVFCAAGQASTHTHKVPGHPALRAPIPGAYVAFALPVADTARQ